MQLIHIQLKHVALKLDRMVRRHLLTQWKQFLQGFWYDTWQFTCPLNRVRLSTTCLPIGKQTNIKTIQCRLHQHSRILKNLLLRSRFIETRIKLVLLILVAGLGFLRHPWLHISLKSEPDRVLVNYSDHWQALHLSFLCWHGPNPTENSYFALHIFDLVVELLPDKLLAVKSNF